MASDDGVTLVRFPILWAPLVVSVTKGTNFCDPSTINSITVV